MSVGHPRLACVWEKVVTPAVAAAVSLCVSLGAATAAPGGPDDVLGLLVWYKAD